MSGHNKWSKIKHKKAATDAQKSKLFSKHASAIALESRKANGDAESAGVRAAVERAKKDSMPQDNILRAIAKGAGNDGSEMCEVTYEAYGPGGVALIITGVTDNKNRAAAEVKSILTKAGCQLASPGSATWAFTKNEGEWQANTTTPISENDGEKLGSLIDTLEDHDDVQGVFTNAE